MRRTSILCLLLLCAVLTAAAGPLSNRRAPGFSLPDSQMRQHDLQDYRGKVVLLNFMQTACPHCNAFSKVLAEAERRFAGKVQVLDVVTTPPDTQATVRNYLMRNGIRQTILFDCRQVAISYLQLTPQNPSFDTPHLFIIDQKGWIQDDYGYSPENLAIFEGDTLFPIIEKLLGQ